MLHKKQTFTFGAVKFHVDPKKPHVILELDGKRQNIKKNELWMMVFAISKVKKQADLIPVVQQEMVPFYRSVSVRASKDMKAGEVIKTNIKIDIPLTIVQAQLTAEEKKELLAAKIDQGHDIPSPFVENNDEKGV